MGQSDNATKSDDNTEIERIIKEIEDLEKSMEETGVAATSTEGASTEPEMAAAAPEVADNSTGGASFDVESEYQEEPKEVEASKNQRHLSLVENDTASSASSANGSLALKIGGCANVSLEFERAGVTINLTCDQSELRITTDQGAEFRLPFKNAA